MKLKYLLYLSFLLLLLKKYSLQTHIYKNRECMRYTKRFKHKPSYQKFD